MKHLTGCLLAASLALSPLPTEAQSGATPAASPAAPCDKPATTILVVRHADRAGKADSLSAAGVARARALVNVARTANLRAIYHSDTKRTRDTAAPLANALGIALEEYPAKEVEALIERIFAGHEGEAVLVVGHSNTVPLIIAAAGGPVVGELPESEFDRLFVVVVPPCRRGSAKLIDLQYGEASP
jgi:broad specificity phosphatase PhoE